jgi:hypothetical protein
MSDTVTITATDAAGAAVTYTLVASDPLAQEFARRDAFEALVAAAHEQWVVPELDRVRRALRDIGRYANALHIAEGLVSQAVADLGEDVRSDARLAAVKRFRDAVRRRCHELRWETAPGHSLRPFDYVLVRADEDGIADP